jgi:hypothetical protein
MFASLQPDMTADDFRDNMVTFFIAGHVRVFIFMFYCIGLEVRTGYERRSFVKCRLLLRQEPEYTNSGEERGH